MSLKDITNEFQQRCSMKFNNQENMAPSNVQKYPKKKTNVLEKKKKTVFVRRQSAPNISTKKKTHTKKGWALLRQATMPKRKSPGEIVIKTHISGLVIKALEQVHRPEIVEEMYGFFKRNEMSHRTSDTYLRAQGDQPFIDESIRYALVNWYVGCGRNCIHFLCECTCFILLFAFPPQHHALFPLPLFSG